ncbi:hypothetical protein HU200_016482 [Digitaria exilis]|uniref:Glycosyltransferase n=1 Tax=Digitaria exilis TaxID=1010633 RepID=A0A835F8B7_9POAL|nr:hypothetical protein HU200_016482 [Digitaria exilis]
MALALSPVCSSTAAAPPPPSAIAFPPRPDAMASPSRPLEDSSCAGSHKWPSLAGDGSKAFKHSTTLWKMAAAHVLLFPWPLQGHLNPMLHLSSALLDAGLHVTLLHTHHNLRRLSLLFHSMSTAGSEAYRAVLRRDTSSSSPVTCVIADGTMPFAITVAEDVGVPAMAFRPESACGFLAYLSMPKLLELGELPSPSDEPVRGVAGMDAGLLRRRDLPRVAPSDPDPVAVLRAVAATAARCVESRALILNTSTPMEAAAVAYIAAQVRGEVFAVGPLHATPAAAAEREVAGAGAEGGGCTAWLDGHADRSVLDDGVTYGARRAPPWLGRRRMVLDDDDDDGGGEVVDVLRLAEKAVANAGEERAMVTEWAAHRDVHGVLGHRAVGCFVTHAGWNSVLELAVKGVPAVCWPYFADQQTVSRFVGAVWGNGLDMKDAVCDRDVVARMVREAMESVEIREKAEAMARRLRMDVEKGGSSAKDLDRLVGFITEPSSSAAAQQLQSSPGDDGADKNSSSPLIA